MLRTTLLRTLLSSTAAILVACDTGSAGTTAPAERPAEEAGQDTPPKKAAPVKAETAPAARAGDPVAEMKTFIGTLTVDKDDQAWRTKVPMPPKLTFDPKMDYFWQLETTEGPIKIRLLAEIAPMHVSSTIYLTELGFYDTLKFHRVITSFMAQGGDPLGNGRGGPAYKYAGEFSPKARHDKPGLLSMANAGPGTDGSQFFLTFVPTPHLDDRHTIFGEVVSGMETVKQLEKFGSQGGKPSKDLAIRTAKIVIEKKAE